MNPVNLYDLAHHDLRATQWSLHLTGVQKVVAFTPAWD